MEPEVGKEQQVRPVLSSIHNAPACDRGMELAPTDKKEKKETSFWSRSLQSHSKHWWFLKNK